MLEPAVRKWLQENNQDIDLEAYFRNLEFFKQQDINEECLNESDMVRFSL